MKRTSLLVATAATALCIPGVIAPAAGASPATLHLGYSHGTSLAPGQEVEGFDSEWKLESSEGSATCSRKEQNEGFLGKDETNDSKTDAISVEKVFGSSFTNSGCSSTISGFSPAGGAWFNGNTQREDVTGKFKLTTKGTAEYVTASSRSTVLFLYNETSGFCFYEVSKLKGTSGTLPGLVSAAFSAQKVKLLKELAGYRSAATCPKKATLSTTVYFYVQLSEGAEAPLEGEVR